MTLQEAKTRVQRAHFYFFHRIFASIYVFKELSRTLHFSLACSGTALNPHYLTISSCGSVRMSRY